MTAEAGTPEALARVGALELCWRSFGAPGDEPVLLLAGLSMQLIAWPAALIEGLVEAHHRVIAYDHRDVGRSTHLGAAGLPDLLGALRRDPRRLAYGLEELAGDALGLLDALGVDRCHLIGISMGAMVAQLCAITAPGRVASLCSMMASPSDGTSGAATPAALSFLVSAGGKTREEVVERAVVRRRALGSPAFAFDEAAERMLAGRAYERGHDPAGAARQLAAVLSARDRTAELVRLGLPALVVHGSADPLIAPSGGEATARAIPGARLCLIEGMGHDLPEDAVPAIVAAVLDNARRRPARPLREVPW